MTKRNKKNIKRAIGVLAVSLGFRNKEKSDKDTKDTEEN